MKKALSDRSRESRKLREEVSKSGEKLQETTGEIQRVTEELVKVEISDLPDIAERVNREIADIGRSAHDVGSQDASALNERREALADNTKETAVIQTIVKRELQEAQAIRVTDDRIKDASGIRDVLRETDVEVDHLIESEMEKESIAKETADRCRNRIDNYLSRTQR